MKIIQVPGSSICCILNAIGGIALKWGARGALFRITQPSTARPVATKRPITRGAARSASKSRRLVSQLHLPRFEGASSEARACRLAASRSAVACVGYRSSLRGRNIAQAAMSSGILGRRKPCQSLFAGYGCSRDDNRVQWRSSGGPGRPAALGGPRIRDDPELKYVERPKVERGVRSCPDLQPRTLSRLEAGPADGELRIRGGKWGREIEGSLRWRVYLFALR